ncbi:MAG: penicillin acylase family protein [Myxococcota bacterium]
MNAHEGRAGPALLALLLAAAGLLAIGLWTGKVRRVEQAALPETEGRIVLAGPNAPVEILRDEHGVPHVIAQSESDAWFGLGFAHAQDRLAQMLWNVRLARGRSAEIIGRAGLEGDRLARVLDLGGIADREWQEATPATRDWLSAYALGVNARVARIRSGDAGAPVAAAAAGLPIEIWQPADSLALLKLHAWSLGGSLEASLVLHDLLGTLGGVDARPFFPSPQDDPTPDGEALPLTADRLDPVRRLTAGRGDPQRRLTAGWVDPLRRASGLAAPSAGSSAWVLGGAHTLEGRPLLVADLHVAPRAPALFHLAHLRGGELDVAGAMLPGVPLVWTGRNAQMAWAATNARAAVTDLYEEMVKDGVRYHDGRRWRPLAERPETIAVRGADDETIVVRSTSHGPLLDGVLPEGGERLALAWVGMRGAGAETLEAWRGVARADDAKALRAALQGIGEPVVALVYADAEGAAGLQVAGWIPRRPLETGLVPVPGRARWYDWNGRIPFERLPRRNLEDGRGWLIAADNSLPHPGVERPEWLWRDGVRARRIDARLRELRVEEPVGLGPLTEIQGDTRDPRAAALVAAALSLVEDDSGFDPQTAEVMDLLRGWDGASGVDSQAAAAYHAFVSSLTRALLAPELGDGLLRRYLAVSQIDPVAVIARMVRGAAAAKPPDGWSDPDRVRPAVRDSLRDTWFELSSQLGASRRKWSWGRLHQLTFAPLLPLPGATLPGLESFGVGGSGATIATASHAQDRPFAVEVASLVRVAADPGDPDGFRAVVAPGQSEHPRSPYFRDGIDPWRSGRLHRVALSDERVREAARERLRLEPVP